MPSRRAFLVGAAVLAAVGVGVGVEEPAVRRRVAEAFAPAPPRPSTSPGPATSGVLSSRAVGQDVSWRLALPPGTDSDARLPLALVLHGRGGDADRAFRDLWFDRYLAAVVTAGAAPFALASVDGGDHSYWHRRRNGADPQTMLTDELLPLLARHGLATDRFGLLGWSMGGYGALLLAETLGAGRVVAVAADSPALWRRFADSAPGAFDDAADFAAHDVFAARARLSGIPVRIACGENDPFYPAVREFLPGVPALAGTDFRAAGHTAALWRSTAEGQLRFLAAALHRS
jgi:enterochelin esterase-like enzyme